MKPDRCHEVLHQDEVNDGDFDSICLACKKRMLAERGKDQGDQSSSTASSSSTDSEVPEVEFLPETSDQNKGMPRSTWGGGPWTSPPIKTPCAAPGRKRCKG